QQPARSHRDATAIADDETIAGGGELGDLAVFDHARTGSLSGARESGRHEARVRVAVLGAERTGDRLFAQPRMGAAERDAGLQVQVQAVLAHLSAVALEL